MFENSQLLSTPPTLAAAASLNDRSTGAPLGSEDVHTEGGRKPIAKPLRNAEEDPTSTSGG